MTDDKIYAEAIEAFGAKPQYDMLIEEMAELTQAILKSRRKHDAPTLENLHEEFVDVEIMMAQIKTLLHPGVLETYRKKKLARLRLLIDKKKGGIHE